MSIRYTQVSPDNPFRYETTVSHYGDINDVVEGGDNGLPAHADSPILKEDGTPIGPDDVQDVRENPDKYTDSPKSNIVAVPDYFYKSGAVKPGDPIGIEYDGKSWVGQAGEVGPGVPGRGVDVPPRAFDELGIDRKQGTARVVVNFNPKLTPSGDTSSSPFDNNQVKPLSSITTSGPSGSNDGLQSVGTTDEGDQVTTDDDGTGGDTSGTDNNITVNNTIADDTKPVSIDTKTGWVQWPGGVYINGYTGMREVHTPSSVTVFDSKGKKISTYASEENILRKTAAGMGISMEDPDVGGDINKLREKVKELSPRVAADPDDIADEVIAGLLPPDPAAWGSRGVQSGKVLSRLGQRGFNVVTARLNYNQALQLIRTGAGIQVVNARARIDRALPAIDLANQLATEWKGGRWAPLNKASLIAAQAGQLHLNGEDAIKAASIADRLLAQVDIVAAEVGGVMQGSPSLSIPVLRSAQEQLKGEWNEQVFHDAASQLKQNLQFAASGYDSALSNPNNPYQQAAGIVPPEKPEVTHQGLKVVNTPEEISNLDKDEVYWSNIDNKKHRKITPKGQP